MLPENSLQQHGELNSVGVLRLSLSRRAGASSLRMPEGMVFGFPT